MIRTGAWTMALLVAVILTAPPPARLFGQTRVVTIAGGVKHPGDYRYEDGLTARALIEKAGGVEGDEIRNFVILHAGEGPQPASSSQHPSPNETMSSALELVLRPSDALTVSVYKSDWVVPNTRTIAGWVAAGEFDNVILAYFGPTRASLFEDKIRNQWRDLRDRLGSFQQLLEVRAEKRGTEHVGVVACQFSDGRAEITAVFSRGGSLLDLSMAPVP